MNQEEESQRPTTIEGWRSRAASLRGEAEAIEEDQDRKRQRAAEALADGNQAEADLLMKQAGELGERAEALRQACRLAEAHASALEQEAAAERSEARQAEVAKLHKKREAAARKADKALKALDAALVEALAAARGIDARTYQRARSATFLRGAVWAASPELAQLLGVDFVPPRSRVSFTDQAKGGPK